MENKRAAVISMVKDECDIIELFVKINSRKVDHLHIIDHDSKDGTTEILAGMVQAGYPVTIYRHESADFQQPLMMSSLARQVAATNHYDYIVPLDADEFIHCGEARLADAVAGQIPDNACGALPWATYVPTAGDYYSAAAPLHEVFRKRGSEPMQFFKLVMPNAVARQCTIMEGNHLAAVDGAALPLVPIPAFLQHVPVRSAEQIVAKALLGNHRMSIKVGRAKNVGIHWDQIADKVRKADYKLSRDDLLEIAFSYADVLVRPVEDFSVDEDAPRVGSESDRIELREQSRINLVKKLDQFAAALCTEVREARGIAEE